MPDAGFLAIERKEHREHGVSCFELLSYPLWLRNGFEGPVILDELMLTFESPFQAPKVERSIRWPCPGVILESQGTKCVHVGITPSLLFLPHSNLFEVTATLRVQGEDGPSGRRSVKATGTDYIIVRPGDVLADEQVFVSFRDPEDLGLAEVAKAMLSQAGFRPYLAREDHGTGADYWVDKIYPAIRESVGTLVIWSAATAGNSSEVLRELRYSREVGVPVGLFREQGVELPAEYPKGKREYTSFQRDAAWVPFANALRSAAERRAREEPFFLG